MNDIQSEVGWVMCNRVKYLNQAFILADDAKKEEIRNELQKIKEDCELLVMMLGDE